jgi:hypothetical protein
MNIGRYPEDDGPPRAAPAYRCPVEGCPHPGVAIYNGPDAGSRYSTGLCDRHWRGVDRTPPPVWFRSHR